MIQPYHPSFVERLVSFFVREPKFRVAFQDDYEDHRTTGYEVELTLSGFHEENAPNLQYQEVYVRNPSSNTNYLLAGDVYRKYGISISTLQRLCRDKIISCEKRSGRWFVSEFSILDYLEKVEDRW